MRNHKSTGLPGRFSKIAVDILLISVLNNKTQSHLTQDYKYR